MIKKNIKYCRYDENTINMDIPTSLNKVTCMHT